MPIITSIKPQKSKKRVNIYLDNKYGFGLDLENFMKLGLKVDQELSDEEIRKIIKSGEFQKVSDKLLNFSMLRPRSIKEVKDWLRRKKVNESIHKDLFNRLKRLELLDDTKFAKWWVEQRLAFKKPSRRILYYELSIKGVEKNIIEDVLEEVNIDEEKIARNLIKSKAYKWERFDEKIKKQKMQTFLLGKGFGWNIVSKVVQ